jgi:hypothetical protein
MAAVFETELQKKKLSKHVSKIIFFMFAIAHELNTADAVAFNKPIHVPYIKHNREFGLKAPNFPKSHYPHLLMITLGTVPFCILAINGSGRYAELVALCLPQLKQVCSVSVEHYHLVAMVI